MFVRRRQINILVRIVYADRFLLIRGTLYLPDIGLAMNNGIPPRSRNQRVPAAWDTPTATAAFSLVIPVATCSQDWRSTSCRSDGAPGERIAPRLVNCCIHFDGRPMKHLLD